MSNKSSFEIKNTLSDKHLRDRQVAIDNFLDLVAQLIARRHLTESADVPTTNGEEHDEA